MKCTVAYTKMYLYKIDIALQFDFDGTIYNGKYYYNLITDDKFTFEEETIPALTQTQVTFISGCLKQIKRLAHTVLSTKEHLDGFDVEEEPTE